MHKAISPRKRKFKSVDGNPKRRRRSDSGGSIMDVDLEEMAMRYDTTGDTSVGRVGGGGMSAEGGLDMREIRADIARTRRVLIAADAWGGRMTDALDRAAMINVLNDPCVDGGEVCVGLDVPGDLDTGCVVCGGIHQRCT